MADGSSTTGPAFEPLAVGEVRLDDANEYYFRQCHPSFLDQGIPTTQIFGDFPSDNGRISGNRGKTTDPRSAYKFHTETLDNDSAGVWAVTVGEVEQVESRVVDDTGAPSVRPPDPVPPGHSYVDMQHLSKQERRRLRKSLRDAAVERRRVYPDETGTLDMPVSE
ncbi:hypothetical protein [Leucobacter luti]|uniref:Uncharacterized protein n=1 Tax=Leucobacter luti TaxID=340320 RepID=A0A4Q7TYX1_9MICO|nr:hypothetical protein [Leucobacter luti]MBL3698997.1 hypothetical protein [Leucobacter luti]RZT66376.1 hypothetical protein EV139_1813 [Leucobacter luti]